jgi:hypothetical protein
MTLPVVRNSQPAARWDPFAELEDLYYRMGALMGAVPGGPAACPVALPGRRWPMCPRPTTPT